jgi:hypothetical protein
MNTFDGCPCSAGKAVCDCGLYAGCAGNCNQGRSPCDCWLANRELADQVDMEAMTELGHRVIPWLCFSGIVGVMAAIIVWGV